MGDREDKVAKAREKLEKFRRKKNKEQPATAAATATAGSVKSSSIEVAAAQEAAATSEDKPVTLAALEQEPQKDSSHQASPQTTQDGISNVDSVTPTVVTAVDQHEVNDEVSQSSNLSSYFTQATADASAKEGSLSSYFQNQSSSETSGISDAFASLVSTIPSMDSISTNLVSTIQELVVEEPQEEDQIEVGDIQQEVESHEEVSSSSVPGPAFYIGSEEGTISGSINDLPVQASEPMMAAPSSSSSSLMQDARVAELIYLLEEEKRGRDEEKRGREAEMRKGEEERKERERLEAEKAKLHEELAGERKRLEEDVGLEVRLSSAVHISQQSLPASATPG